MTFPIVPDEASLGARDVDQLMIALLAMTAFFVILVAGPIIYFSFKYRRSNPVNREYNAKGTLKLEIAWTVIPLLIAVGLFLGAASLYFQQRHPPEGAMEIHVVGKQWMWKLQHPQGKREINELHLPLGVPVKLLMTSQDVIHSFYIPAFRVKQDVLPDRFSTVWMVPSKLGTYHLFCTQFCGTSHSRMIGRVIVMTPQDYQRWLISGEQSESPVLTGSRLFRQYGCSGCHVGSPVVRAPSLEGVYGSVVPLEGGRTVIADDRYLRDSILLPNSEVVAGYAPVMPSFQGRISEDDLMALIAYLKSLGGASEGGRVQPLNYSDRPANPVSGNQPLEPRATPTPSAPDGASPQPPTENRSKDKGP